MRVGMQFPIQGGRKNKVGCLQFIQNTVLVESEYFI